MAENFIKVKEDFICGYCGKDVKGDGYTNHCPFCLWSKHVDINPGDRGSECGGLMEPEQLEKDGDEFVITHKCLDCGYQKRNKTALTDDISDYLERVIQ
ncbi:MAG: RNHCP domain-containing protein [Patescibacteria group bacterium]